MITRHTACCPLMEVWQRALKFGQVLFPTLRTLLFLFMVKMRLSCRSPSMAFNKFLLKHLSVLKQKRIPGTSMHHSSKSFFVAITLGCCRCAYKNIQRMFQHNSFALSRSTCEKHNFIANATTLWILQMMKSWRFVDRPYSCFTLVFNVAIFRTQRVTFHSAAR